MGVSFGDFITQWSIDTEGIRHRRKHKVQLCTLIGSVENSNKTHLLSIVVVVITMVINNNYILIYSLPIVTCQIECVVPMTRDPLRDRYRFRSPP